MTNITSINSPKSKKINLRPIKYEMKKHIDAIR